MSSLQNKIDFVALVSVTRANSNGDPLNGNRPRTDLNGFGEISDVCIKRKIRNRMQDLGKPIFVQSEDRRSDGCGSLSERASAAMKGIKDREEYARRACETWLDVRAFGQVFAFKDAKGFSCGVRGPVCFCIASSTEMLKGLLLRCARAGLRASGVQPVPRGDRVPPDHQEREW